MSTVQSTVNQWLVIPQGLGMAGSEGGGSADPLKFGAEVRNCLWCLHYFCVVS